MLDHLDCMQVSPVLPFLPAIREHPDFQKGLCAGQQAFQEGMFWDDHEKAWTEDDIIEFVAEESSEMKYRREQRIDRVMGCSSPSYLHRLGFTISYLDQALAAKAQ